MQDHVAVTTPHDTTSNDTPVSGSPGEPPDTSGTHRLRKRYEEFSLAVTLLTRCPWPRFEIITTASLTGAVWAYPIIGAGVGTIGASVGVLAMTAGLGPWISALLTVAAIILVTGGLHEDGLADFCDGVGGGQTRDAKLQIMRDSRLGTYGVLAIIFAVFLHTAAVSALMEHQTAMAAAASLVAAVAISRAMVLVPMWLLCSVRNDGQTAVFETPGRVTTVCTILIAVGVGALAWPPAILLACLMSAGAAALVVTAIASTYLGGYSGDGLGATIALSHVAILLMAVSLTS
ncbi:MAG: adenosylcobinamide-GDP ribazoletransferase [Pseudomonadota bacterium]